MRAVTHEQQDKVPARKVLEFWDLPKLESGEAYSPKRYLRDRIEFCAFWSSAKSYSQSYP